MSAHERASRVSKTTAELRRCPACGMEVDDRSLDLCPLCFYDLESPPPDTGFDAGPLATEHPRVSADFASPVSLVGRSGLDAVIALIPLIVLVLVLVVALIER